MRIVIKDKPNFILMFNHLFEDNKIDKINGITIDSRLTQKNDIYIPFKGENYDGHNFITEALKKGAIKCFSEKKNMNKNIINIKSSTDTINKLASSWNNIAKHKIIGITGSNGKTTTKELLHFILSKKMKCFKSSGNYNSTIGLPISYLNSNREEDFCILEYGASKVNEIEYLCKIIKPDISIITNISNAHIKNYNSIEKIHETKKAIFDCLDKKDMAFINLDDKYISTNKLSCKSFTYSINKKANYTAIFKKKKNESILSINNMELTIPNDLKHLCNIILPVYAILIELGIKHSYISKCLNDFTLPIGRGKKLIVNKFEIIDDSYNANPSSVLLAINRLNSTNTKGKKIFIFGDMLELGKESEAEHKKIGDFLNRTKINIVITFGEKSIHTHNQIKQSIIQKNHFTNIDELVIYLRKIITKGDLLYLKGSRSMKLEKVYESGLA